MLRRSGASRSAAHDDALDLASTTAGTVVGVGRRLTIYMYVLDRTRAREARIPSPCRGVLLFRSRGRYLGGSRDRSGDAVYECFIINILSITVSIIMILLLSFYLYVRFYAYVSLCMCIYYMVLAHSSDDLCVFLPLTFKPLAQA